MLVPRTVTLNCKLSLDVVQAGQRTEPKVIDITFTIRLHCLNRAAILNTSINLFC